jgi:hydantoinase/carbamoylase family amidase
MSRSGPEGALADLRELAELTGGPEGAQRLAWTDEWLKAREWLRGKLGELPVEVDQDEAGNIWATMRGEKPSVLVVGSHVDSVPNGGWLDGALGIAGALAVLRAHAEGTPPVTLRLVDWADEEGARFGRSLFGSSAVAGTLDPAAVADLRDRDGRRLEDVLGEHGVDIRRAGEAGSRLDDVAAYLELHIEQGPVLERMGRSAGAVIGTFGVERHAVTFMGRANHAGSTPMDLRQDAFLAAARFGLAARDGVAEGAVATIGRVNVEPGVPTIINGRCTVTLDQRAFDPDVLAGMLAGAQEASRRIAAEEDVEVAWEHIWRIEPIAFHPELVDLAEAAIRDETGEAHRLPSGPLHDAAEMARRVPTVMMFTPSTGGVSHNREEDTPEADLLAALRAYLALAEKALSWVAAWDAAA